VGEGEGEWRREVEGEDGWHRRGGQGNGDRTIQTPIRSRNSGELSVLSFSRRGASPHPDEPEGGQGSQGKGRLREHSSLWAL